MKNFFNKKFSTKTKLISSAISLMLIVCFAITGTVAWLMDATEPVTDTFVMGHVDIMLIDADDANDGLWSASEHYAAAVNDANYGLYNDSKFKLIPGAVIQFNPAVKVGANSENCYVFIKIEKTNSTFGDPADDAYEYNLTSEWESIGEGIYGCKNVLKANDEQTIIDGGKLTVNVNLTNGAITSEPTIKFTAYAIQSTYLPDGADTLSEIWDLIDPNTTPYTPAP